MLHFARDSIVARKVDRSCAWALGVGFRLRLERRVGVVTGKVVLGVARLELASDAIGGNK
jgi:hypothetical protein